MFCIAAFIVLAIISIFSASHRQMTKKAWYCVSRKLTFRPCDINFGEELKGKILGKLIFKRPNLAKFLNKSFDWLALAFVAISIWSVVAVGLAGLNLWVYDTCDPVTGEACSLSGEACGVGRSQLSLTDAISQNRLLEYITNPFTTLAETISRVPDRLKNWQAKDYLSPTATFYTPENPSLPYALEVLDPSCLYCKKLFLNIKQTDFTTKNNLSYLAYPIPDPNTKTGYKFPHSYLITSYLEATKKLSPSNPTSQKSPDWQLLEQIFTGQDTDEIPLQNKFNSVYDSTQAESKIQELLTQIGYTPEQITELKSLTQSPEIQTIITEQKQIVEQKIRTIKIPTILFDGRRYDRVIEPSQLGNPIKN